LVVATLDGDNSTTSPSVRSGIAVAPDLESACRSVAALATAARFDAPLQPRSLESIAPTSFGRTYTAATSFAEFERAGIRCAPYLVVNSVEAARAAAVELGFPVVVKSNVPAATHKEKAGGVQLDVIESTLTPTVVRLLVLSDSLIVARQLRGAPELFASVRRNSTFGSVVVAGLGGGHMETIDRVVTLPATATEAWLTGRLVDAVFGPGDESRRVARLLASMTARLATLAESIGATLVECNPLIEFEGDLVALDARIIASEMETDV
jgi:acyl-CoA synthetase (NDP forming)